MGSVSQKNNAQYVQDDFMFATAADIVADPSAPDFVDGIMEGVEWIKEMEYLDPWRLSHGKTRFDKPNNHLEEKLEMMKNFFSKL